ncbi:leucocin A/sakacin P family class II bacteriocin [Enterococcus sp. AZ163]|uniref:leucocin A/sakacin P family class II bacteriocin n=1 Tax=Enterococcus sp. AZ163 TaxID=2774638 RepID=UPI003D2E0B3C
MKKVHKLTIRETQKIIGGIYCSNGVNCGKYTCTVNWVQSWNESLDRWDNSLVGGLLSIRQK